MSTVTPQRVLISSGISDFPGEVYDHLTGLRVYPYLPVELSSQREYPGFFINEDNKRRGYKQKNCCHEKLVSFGANPTLTPTECSRGLLSQYIFLSGGGSSQSRILATVPNTEGRSAFVSILCGTSDGFYRPVVMTIFSVESDTSSKPFATTVYVDWDSKAQVLQPRAYSDASKYSISFAMSMYRPIHRFIHTDETRLGDQQDIASFALSVPEAILELAKNATMLVPYSMSMRAFDASVRSDSFGRLHFLFDEPAYIFNSSFEKLIDLYGADHGVRRYWREYAKQQAYVDCCESVPRMNDNSISNILELIGFMKALIIDHKIEIPHSLKDAWLSYRYQYNTTKLDVNEAIKFIRANRTYDWSATHRVHGKHIFDFQGVTCTMRCSASFTPKYTDTVKRLWKYLYTYGLTPDFYVIWDMIPYSFVVDWFIPIGDMVLATGAANHIEEYYIVTNVVYSLTYSLQVGSNTHKFYSRWRGEVPKVNGMYWLESNDSSTKVKVYRLLDTISLRRTSR